MEGSSFLQLHHLTRSFDTLSRNREDFYSDSMSEVSMTLEPVSNRHSDIVDSVSNTCSNVTCPDSNSDDGAKATVDEELKPGINVDSLNTNNGANNDQLSKKAAQSPKKEKSAKSVLPSERVKSQKRIPFVYDSLPAAKNSLSSIQIGQRQITASRKHSNISSKGRKFVRSSSIMVKSGGKEVSALNISASKGHIQRGSRDVVDASKRSNFNLLHNFQNSDVDPLNTDEGMH